MVSRNVYLLFVTAMIALLVVAGACSGSDTTTDQSPTPTRTPSPTVAPKEAATVTPTPTQSPSPKPTPTATPEHSRVSPPDLASIPLASALASGKPTLAEFGRGICTPCKMMKPILEELSLEYEGRLNVVIVEVYEHMDLARQYGIMAIPTQIFFDDTGQETARHIGFWPKEEIQGQVKGMGIQ